MNVLLGSKSWARKHQVQYQQDWGAARRNVLMYFGPFKDPQHKASRHAMQSLATVFQRLDQNTHLEECHLYLSFLLLPLLKL
jgi:hypothetical protein